MLHADIFKANDIRGIVTGDQPQFDLDGARLIGAAFAQLLDLDGKEFVLGRDMRRWGRELSLAFAEGARSHGASVIDVGLASTDQLWFSSGHLSVPGVQFTASHNPADYNGIKFCLADARPVPEGFTANLRDLTATVELGNKHGNYSERDLLSDYAEKLWELVPAGDGPELSVVIDAGNGMAGHTCMPVLAGRGLNIIGLYLDLDGTFPNHPANPLVPENLIDARRAVKEQGADLGLVFDGDADRCFIIDERGEVVDPSVVTAMIATAELDKEPGGTVVRNTITSWAVEEAIEGIGHLVTSQVGHTYVKAAMSAADAIFGGEHSAHYYFRDFWFADTGMLAALHIIEMLRASDVELSQLAAKFDTYHRSGEINSTVTNGQACQQAVARAFESRGDVTFPDGLLVANHAHGWWLNLRPSNTEPLLRLNVEARNAETMAALRDEVLGIINEVNGTRHDFALEQR